MAKKESSGFNKPFEGLKRLAQKPPAPARPAPARPAPSKPEPPKPAPASGKAAASDDEQSFAEAMRGAVPLTGAASRGRRTSPLGAPPPRPAPRPRAPARNDDADAEAELAELVSGTGGVARDGDRRLSRRLRNGDYPSRRSSTCTGTRAKRRRRGWSASSFNRSLPDGAACS